MLNHIYSGIIRLCLLATWCVMTFACTTHVESPAEIGRINRPESVDEFKQFKTTILALGKKYDLVVLHDNGLDQALGRDAYFVALTRGRDIYLNISDVPSDGQIIEYFIYRSPAKDQAEFDAFLNDVHAIFSEYGELTFREPYQSQIQEK